jgi:hypothetical protein
MRELTYKYKLTFVKGGSGELIDSDRAKLREWMKDAKDTYISQKRKTNAAALKEFKSLYEPSEWYCSFYDSPNYRDDSFQVFFKTSSVSRNPKRPELIKKPVIKKPVIKNPRRKQSEAAILDLFGLIGSCTVKAVDGVYKVWTGIYADRYDGISYDDREKFGVLERHFDIEYDGSEVVVNTGILED